ncbi:MFS family permease [Arthrobacter stackebrandtii]|uniref:MFS family permease n=1 Tax=Arthrobacter stackebrandtii TaxID=272161 RepID=A0ABS4Z2N4_9MICC|nr:permease prefix domain 1-containing protein [Arthrobacter stackebrandtii]MBP2414523.1 MFS family permease [Arthrobacter stackebrandtii]PYH01637.1 hypothetical protein CVV67_03995 [Arthrobacter stackebrandtii]
MSSAGNHSIHRLLDEAFGGVSMTPEVQDLKEEIRGNLAARVDELADGGMEGHAAAAQAMDELGDIRELVGEVAGPGPQAGASAPAAALDFRSLHRVRPKPAYVVGVVIASIVIAAGLLFMVLGATGVLPLPIGPVIGLAGLASTGAAWIVGDTLAHETTTNYPVSKDRAGGYFFATLLGVYGLAIGGLVALGALPVWVVVFAALGVVAAIVLFAFLGATQTNRKKAWVREAAREYQGQDRFSQDPVAAARFGIYSAVIWIVAFGLFAGLGFMVGFGISWLALLAGLAVHMVVLARMLFPSGGPGAGAGTAGKVPHS